MDQLVYFDAAITPLWLTVNALLIMVTFRLAVALEPEADLSQRIIVGTVAAICLIVVSAIALSLLGILTGVSLLICVGVISSIGLRSLPAGTHHDSSSVDGFCLQLLGVRVSVSSMLAVALWGGLFTFLLSHILVNGLLKFPEDWDCLMYHMPMIDEWIQARSLYSADSAYWWQPGVSELIGFWIVAPFSGDFLIALNNLPAVVLWSAATWSIARALGLSPAWSHLTTVAVLAVYTTIHETDDASNDLAVVAFWSAALASGLGYCKDQRPWLAVVCGASLGLLVGVKYFALGYAGVLFLAMVGAMGFHRGSAAAFRLATTLLLAGIPIGVYWYLRNFIISGSPVFPLGLAGPTSSLGYPNLIETTFWGNSSPLKFGIAAEVLWKWTGPCHVVSLAATPFTLIGLLFTSGRYQRDQRTQFIAIRLMICMIALAGAFLIWVITPMLVEDEPGTLNHLRMGYTPIRFGLCFLSLSITLSAAVTKESLRLVRQWSPIFARYGNRFAYFTVAAATAWQVIRLFQTVWHDFNFVDTFLFATTMVAFAILAAVLHPFSVHKRPMRRLNSRWVATALAATIGVATLSRQWHCDFDRHFCNFLGTQIFTRLSKNYPDENRLCVLDLRIYPFFGSSRRRHISRPRHVESIEWLREYVGSKHLSLLIVHSPSGRAWDMYDSISETLRIPQTEFALEQVEGSHLVFNTPAPQ